MKILFPVEDEYLAGEQLDFLLSHNWQEPLSFYVVTVVHHSYQPSSEVPAEYQYAEELTKKIVHRLSMSFPESGITIGVAEGNASEAILKIASEWASDLIVLASHGRRGIGQLVLGSVSYEVLSKSPCRTIMLGTPLHDFHEAKPINETIGKLRFSQ